MVLGVSFGRQFSDPEEVRDELHKEHPDKISWAMKEVGYIQWGHSCKGKQHWIVSKRDIEEMYKDHKGAREILLWCYSKDDNDVTLLSKRPWVSASSASSFASKTSQAESIAQKLTEVDEIDSGLSEKHSKMYTAEQIRAWAHLIHMNKHDSYDVPPNKPILTRRKERASATTGTHLSGKKIGLRSQCIDQLKKWHELLECGGITQAQYDELQATIMGDIKQL